MITRLRNQLPCRPETAAMPTASRDAGIPFDVQVRGGLGQSPPLSGSQVVPRRSLELPAREETFEPPFFLEPEMQTAHGSVVGSIGPDRRDAVSNRLPLLLPSRNPGVENVSNHAIRLRLPDAYRVLDESTISTAATGGAAASSAFRLHGPDVAESMPAGRAILDHLAHADVLEVQIRSGVHQSSETISVPWRLLAHMLLSQQGQATAAETVRETLPEVVGSIPSAAAEASSATPTPVAHGVTLLAAPDRSSASVASIEHPPRGQPHASGEDAVAEKPSPSIVAASPWALRLIRWATDHASETVLWMRDYTIDESAEQGLMQMLHAFGQAHGLQVTRLMFNGRELWRAPR